ncbi:hypothetical protein [Clostridium sp.]|nr:hypothetical protein [Clostridium sp.]MDU4736911.1 hypothetical protein [Clostridium sp.]MDU7364447.1 hypothetical protein [Clostridium sp.]
MNLILIGIELKLTRSFELDVFDCSKLIDTVKVVLLVYKLTE